MANNIKASWPKIILFGDSITQRSFEAGQGHWGALLANNFQRICDVVPRGFSGYNSEWCRMIMPNIFAEFAAPNVACVVILLGSNDSCLPDSGTKQHIPLKRYQDNLSYMVDYLESIKISKQRVILMSPPNYHNDDFVAFCKKNYDFRNFSKSDESTLKYAQAAAKVALDKEVTFLDLSSIFRSWTADNRSLFVDGLHLSALGAQLLFSHLKPVVEEKVKTFLQGDLEKGFHYPEWSQIDAANPEKSLK